MGKTVFFLCACVHGRNKVALIKVLLPSSKDGGKRFHLKQTPPNTGSSFSKELFLFFTVRNNRAWRYPRVFASGPRLCTFFFSPPHSWQGSRAATATLPRLISIAGILKFIAGPGSPERGPPSCSVGPLLPESGVMTHFPRPLATSPHLAAAAAAATVHPPEPLFQLGSTCD